MGLGHSPRIVTDGLVLCLDAANARSYPGTGTTWNDLIGNFSGTATNGVSFTNDNAGSVFFDGTDEKIVGACAPVKYQNWSKASFTTVFKHTGTTGASANHNGRQYIWDFRHNGGGNGIIGLFADDTLGTPELTLFYSTTGTGYEEPTAYVYSLGEWIIYTFTFDKTTTTNNIRHYINGENVYNRSVTSNSTTTDTGNNITIGDYSQTYTNYAFNGHIPFISVNTGVIFTEQQVRQNYEALRGRYE